MLNLGVIRPGSTVRIPFSTFDKDDGSSITMSNYAAADILVYKDGNTTERGSTNGYTATTNFDSKTGKHLAVIDLADNTTAGFWNAGSEYLVAIDSVDVDGISTGGWIARFQIGYDGANLDTTIASLSSQTSFTLTAGPAEDDALNGHWAIIHDIASAVQRATVLITDYVGSTKTVTLAAGATFTVAAGDNVSVMDLAPLQPTVIGRTLDVSSGGEAGLDWANIGNPTTAQNLSATNIDVDQVVASVTGAVGSVAANGITASSLAADAGSEIAAAVWAESTRTLTAIDEDTTTLDLDATIRGAVGLASANLDTQVDALPTAAENATAVWGAGTRTLTALDEDNTTLDLDATIRAAVGLAAANLDTQIDALPTAAENATAVWGAGTRSLTILDEDSTTLDLDATIRAAVGLGSANLDTQLAAIDDAVDTEVSAIKATTDKLDQTLVNSSDGYIFTAAALQDAPTGGSAPTASEIADEVETRTIAGVTTVGTVNALAANSVNASALAADAVAEIQSGLATSAALATVDTVVDAIQAKTDNLPSDPADASVIAGEFTTVNSKLDAIDNFVDTEVSAIKAVTDKLDGMVENTSDGWIWTIASLQNAPGGAGGLTAADVWAHATRTLTAIDEDSTTLDLDATIRGAVGLSAANLDTQIDALPTAAENATAVWGAGARTLTALDEDSTTVDLDAAIRAAVGLASANLDTQLGTIDSVVDEVDLRGERTVVRGTVGGGSSNTSIVTSAFSPAGAVADQFKGRIVVFDNDTATAALRGQATDITASSNSATPTLTVTTLTTVPASGDTFSVL